MSPPDDRHGSGGSHDLVDWSDCHDWDDWSRRMAALLASFVDGDFVNTSGPLVAEERPPGLFGRRRRPRVLAAPAVRFLRFEDHLMAESVAPFPSLEEPPVSEEQRARFRGLGWLLPGDEGYESMGGPLLRLYLPGRETDRAATLAADTYRVLGLATPDEVEVERGH